MKSYKEYKKDFTDMGEEAQTFYKEAYKKFYADKGGKEYKGNFHNDAGDAFRHAYAAAKMAQSNHGKADSSSGHGNTSNFQSNSNFQGNPGGSRSGGWSHGCRTNVRYAASHVSPLVLDLDRDGLIELLLYANGGMQHV